MMTLLFLFLYAAVLVCAIACIVRAYSYARAPVHLRWELYPVPHEEARRVAHGGSYFELVDWWTHPVHFNLWGELKFMVPEMVFLKGLWEFNRPLWFRSFPFHFGLYLLAGTVGLVFVHALLDIAAPSISTSALGSLLPPLYTLTAVLGGVLCILGALSLLHRRLTDRALRNYTVPGDIFNLLFFIITLGLLFIGFAAQGPESPDGLAIARALLTFDTAIAIPGMVALGLFLAGLLAAYTPMTHMAHFIAKYFTYHSIRWDDKPIAQNKQLARKIAEQLAYRPTWSAAHVMADGKKNWVDIATSNPAQGAQK